MSLRDSYFPVFLPPTDSLKISANENPVGQKHFSQESFLLFAIIIDLIDNFAGRHFAFILKAPFCRKKRHRVEFERNARKNNRT